MQTASNRRRAEPIRILTVGAALLGMSALLVFPAMRAHHFNTSLRACPALSRIQRHIFVAQPQAGPAVNAAATTFLRVMLDGPAFRKARPASPLKLGCYVPLPRLLSRLRLGARSAPDPLV